MKRVIFVGMFIPLIVFSQRSLELHISNISRAVVTDELQSIENKAFYNIELSLKNDSYYSSTLFWNMSCSWAESFIFADDNFYILYRCKSNGPVRYLILPRTIIRFKGILCTPMGTTMEELKNLQVGFVFCDGQTLSRDTYYNIRHYNSREKIKSKFSDSFDIIWNCIWLEDTSKSEFRFDSVGHSKVR